MSLASVERLIEEIGLLLGELFARREAALPDLNAYLARRRGDAPQLSDFELITVLRATFSFREYLTEWSPLRDATLTELTTRHGRQRAASLLRGLLGEVTPRQLPSV